MPSSSATAPRGRAKVDSMLTDPQRTHRHVPGDPLVCPYSLPIGVLGSATGPLGGGGCGAPRSMPGLQGRLKEVIGPGWPDLRAARRVAEDAPLRVDAALPRGTERAREEARRDADRGPRRAACRMIEKRPEHEPDDGPPRIGSRRLYDGPLDLLLHLVRINEVDITNTRSWRSPSSTGTPRADARPGPRGRG